MEHIRNSAPDERYQAAKDFRSDNLGQKKGSENLTTFYLCVCKLCRQRLFYCLNFITRDVFGAPYVLKNLGQFQT